MWSAKSQLQAQVKLTTASTKIKLHQYRALGLTNIGVDLLRVSARRANEVEIVREASVIRLHAHARAVIPGGASTPVSVMARVANEWSHVLVALYTLYMAGQHLSLLLLTFL